MNEDLITIKYIFEFQDNSTKELSIRLKSDSLELIPEKKTDIYPYWTELEKFQCPVCPLNKSKHKYCPLAAELSILIEDFSGVIHQESVKTTTVTAERNYSKTTSLQEGLQSVVGIYMVTTGCPIMEKLKPLVRYHMPFATVDETNYRVLSMYLLAQYFFYKHGTDPDMDLKAFLRIYDDIREVNKNFHDKLSNLEVKDSTINALMGLECFAFSVSYIVNTDNLEKLESLFSAYFK